MTVTSRGLSFYSFNTRMSITYCYCTNYWNFWLETKVCKVWRITQVNRAFGGVVSGPGSTEQPEWLRSHPDTPQTISASSDVSTIEYDPCSIQMRLWGFAVSLLCLILLLGRRFFWNNLIIGTDLLEGLGHKATSDSTVFYMILAIMTSFIYPFFLSNFPNPLRIILCNLIP